MKWNKNELQWKKQEWKNACGGEKTKSGTLEMKEVPLLDQRLCFQRNEEVVIAVLEHKLY